MVKFYQKLIEKELKRATKKHPKFPEDVIHQVAIMSEEAGEAVRAANNYIHEGGSIADLQDELIQTASSCIRVLINL